MYVLWMILEAAVVGALGYFFVLPDPQDRTSTYCRKIDVSGVGKSASIRSWMFARFPASAR